MVPEPLSLASSNSWGTSAGFYYSTGRDVWNAYSYTDESAPTRVMFDQTYLSLGLLYYSEPGILSPPISAVAEPLHWLADAPLEYR